MMHSRRLNDGFTAVELLITLFVAAAFIIAGYQLFNVVIKDGGETRAESRAANIAYDYLRRYSDSATNPCVPSSPITNQTVTVDELVNVRITVAITCPQPQTTSLSKVDATITYNTPSSTVHYATYVDKSKGASPNTTVTEGLLAQYKLNGNAKASVGGPDGVVYGATPTTNRSGTPNSAYAFNAAVDSQYIEIPSTFGIGTTNATISLWVYQASASASGQYVKIGDPAGFGIGIGGSNFDNNTPGSKIIGLFEGVRWIDTGTNLGTGWHYIAMTLNSSGTPSFYRDGSLVGTYAGAGTQAPNGDIIRIGGRGGRFVTGSIDDVRFYNRALTVSEISQLNAAGPQ